MAYVDVNGNEFESYEHACYYYGCDTPAQIAAEEKWQYEQECMEGAYLSGHLSDFYEPWAPFANYDLNEDDIPF